VSHPARYVSIGFDDPRVDDYRRVLDGDALRRRNLFVAEGRLVVGRLIDSGLRVVSLLVNDASRRAMEASIARLPGEVPVYVCDSGSLGSITGFNLHRGCLALAVRPPRRTLADVTRDGHRLLVLEGVTDADNVGSAFRNAAAFGARVLLSPTCCDPLYRKAIRTSMGSVLSVPYARLNDWPGDLSAVKGLGFTLAALTPRAHAKDLAACEGHRRLALLVGSEGPGLTPEAEQRADLCVRIPMSEAVDSLNLATATGIALHHFRTLRT
jgi:tRNA G18 (ribose-2'-O)-methylase SpoU